MPCVCTTLPKQASGCLVASRGWERGVVPWRGKLRKSSRTEGTRLAHSVVQVQKRSAKSAVLI